MVWQRALVAGTRGSRLALRQTETILEALRAARPNVTFEVREVRTEGDRNASASLATIGGQGVFVKALEDALLRREIDFAVHSLKDMPAETAPGLVIAAVPHRADPRDALVAREGAGIADLPQGARVGTGSARRAVQLRSLRPDVEAIDIRGNVDTRIRKVDSGAYDAAVLAVAGLERLGLLDRASEIFEPEAFLPAVGQGALAVEARADDTELIELLPAVDDSDAHRACDAERAFLLRLGGGCRLPFGALARVEGETLRICGFISNDGGSETFRAETDGPVADAESAGVRLAESLLEQGAERFVEALG